MPTQLQRLLKIPAAVNPVSHREPHHHRQVLGPGCADPAHHLERQAHAVFQAAAERIVAPVAQGREELVQQVAVRHVHLDHLEAGLQGTPCRSFELRGDLFQVDGTQLARLRRTRAEGQSAGRDRLPAAGIFRCSAATLPGRQNRTLAAGMAQLDCRNRTLRGDKVRDRFKRLGLGHVPETAVARADPPFRGHRGRFDDHHRGAADRPAAEVDHVPVVRQTVLAGVLAHRRNENPVAQRQRTQLQRRKQLAHKSSLKVGTRDAGRGKSYNSWNGLNR